eukprot:12407181-Karenia_brevis.AAC.1
MLEAAKRQDFAACPGAKPIWFRGLEPGPRHNAWLARGRVPVNRWSRWLCPLQPSSRNVHE